MIEFDVSVESPSETRTVNVPLPVAPAPWPTRVELEARLRDWVPAHPGQGLLLGLLEVGHLDDLRESRGMDFVDRLLDVIVSRLHAGLPTGAWLAALRQGRYAVVLPHEPVADQAVLGELSTRLIDLLAVPLTLEGTQLYPFASLGWAWSAAPADGQDLLRRALVCLREAEPVGPGQWRFRTREADDRRFTPLELETALRRALLRQEGGGTLSLEYQPQLALSHGGVIGLEALLRWEHPVFGAIAPQHFVPLAERTGLIVHLGAWVLHSACAQAMQWLQDGLPPVRVAVNLSAYQLHRTDIVGEIQAALLATHLPPERLGVEVTEGMLMGDVSAVAKTLRKIKALGVEIALDDFGTGYSSLAHLRHLPIDVVKVDRSFVHDVTAATEDVSITRAIINMAHSLQMRVLAEGVETDGQLALLVANHCDLIQGHLFSPSLRPEGVAALLREGRALAPAQIQRRSRARTLLLVDDEDNIVASLRRLVRKDGYTILTAHSGAQALQRLAENEVDVIVSDQRMPGMTGVEFLRRAKELYPETVRMVLSGYTELNSITDAINEGAIYKFLTKPWDDERLRAHVAEAFQHKEMVDENRRLGQEVQDANRKLAAVNERLQRLLQSQRERMDREGRGRGIARELLESIPTPVIGFDLEGVIAFMNADAERLFEASAPLGQVAPHALAPALIEVWRRGDGVQERVELDGRPYQVVCRPMEGASGARGKLMVLTPQDALVA